MKNVTEASWFFKAIHPGTLERLRGAQPGKNALPPPAFIRNVESWKFLLEYSEKVHAALPFTSSIERAGWIEELPEEAHKAIEKRLRRERMILALLDDEFDFAHARLAHAGIECILLKGMDLGRRFYPERIFRPMTDVDLLVRPDRFEDAIECLKVAGFQVVGDFPKGRFRIELGRFSIAHEGPVIELHKFLQEGDTEESIRDIWNRSRAGLISGLPRDVRSLSHEDLLAYLIRHAGVQHLVESPVWLSDIHFVASSEPFRGSDSQAAWDLVFEQLVHWKAIPAAHFVLLFLKRFYGTEIPESFMTRLKARISPLKAGILGRRATPSSLFPPEGRSFAWTASTRLLLRQGPIEAMNYAVRRIKTL